MRQTIFSILLMLLPIVASADVLTTRTVDNAIEGIYQVQPTSYRLYNGNNVAYLTTLEIMIINNGDGTYYVDDLFGGWYSQRAGYGHDYCMTGNIMIAADGSVLLLDSYVIGWGDSLSGLTGTYNASSSTFTIEAEYVSGMQFFQTWVKTGQVQDFQGFNSDGINYNFGENNTVSVAKGKYSGDIIIPNQVSYDGIKYSVTSIDADAFAGCINLTSVNIPNTVTSLDGVFVNCIGLTSITIPNSVKSIRGTFRGCTSLTSIIIPNSVTSLDDTFIGCTGLSSVTIPNNVTSIDRAFSGCTGLTSVTIPNSVKSIDGAFSGCTGLTSITIPNSVTAIGEDTFWECSSLNSVMIPSSVSSIGNYAFGACSSLVSITIPKGVKTIGDGVFMDCSKLTSLTIPQSVIQIGGWITSRCPINSIRVESENPVYDSRNNCNAIIETASNTLIIGCKNTIIPSSINTIGESAFSYCTSLTSIIIPTSVTSIEKGAFSNCFDLNTLSIPSCVESIENGAFQNCTGLTFLELSEGLIKIGDYGFSGCSSLTSIILPQSVKSIGDGCFSGCSSIETITVKEDNPFYDSRDNSNCIIEKASNSLVLGCKNTIIPNGIVTIGNRAFSGCNELSSISIPKSVNRIGDYAFISCSALSTIDIPNSVYSIGEMAFANCSSLTSIILPSSVSVIHGAVFFHCDNLASVTIYNCSYFEYQYFSYCSKLKDLYLYMEQAPQVSYNAFTYTDIGNITLHVPASSINTYRTSEPWRSFKEIVEIDMTDIITPPIKNNSGKDIYYNLNGQRESNPSKGIYIRNGKKIIVR